MFIRTYNIIVTMATSLAVLGIVRALTIDNQLTVIKNDCYERMAIGQRLNPKSVYKTFDYNTVMDCQMACTKEKDICKAFSFGIGPKGNATCELSTEIIKETVDLKPIGTTADTDFDLYIKKLGCKVVIDKTPQFPVSNNDKPHSSDDNYQTKPSQGSHTSYDETPNNSYHKPDRPESNDVYNKPSTSRPDDGYENRPPNGYTYNKPNNRPSYDSSSKPIYGDQSEHVQTLVSIANGPNSYLDPVHGILIGDDPYGPQNKPNRPQENNRPGYGEESRPPFRPSTLNHPYHDSRPENTNSEYGSRPDPDRYDNIPTSLVTNGYGGKPIRPQDEYGSRPRPPKPSSQYDDRPPRPYDDRPTYENRPIRPPQGYDDRPSRPYDEIRPTRPPQGYDDRPTRPPQGYDDRPTRPPQAYDDRPPRPYDEIRPMRPSEGYDNRPLPDDYNRPSRPSSNGYNNKPDYDERPSRPSRPGDRYGERPDSGYDIRPPRPILDSYDRPSRPNPDRYGDRPSNDVYHERPVRPMRPSGYDRPDIDRYDNHRPSGINRYDDRYGPPFRPEPDSHFRPLLPYEPHPIRPLPDRYGSVIPHPDDYDRRPEHGYMYKPETDRYDSRPIPRPIYKPLPDDNNPNSLSKPGSSSQGYDKKSNDKSKPSYGNKTDNNNVQSYEKPNKQGESSGSYGGSSDKGEGSTKGKGDSGYGSEGKPIVTQSVGYHGETITSIITELHDACFRRVLAGKRVSRQFVKRAVTCESVEECQRECADEKRFICEGFNYRLDPRGRGKGDCELLDLPLSRLDIGRDIYPDPDYDYYEKDRNAAAVNCKQYRPGNGYQSYDGGYKGGYGENYGESYGGSYYYSGGGNRYDSYNNRRYDVKRPDDYGLRRPAERWPDDYKYGHRQPRPEFVRRYDDDRDRPTGNRRGDYSYHHSHHSQHDYENSHNYHYSYNDRDSYQDNHHYSGIYYLPATHFHRPHHDVSYDYKPPNRYDRPYNDKYLPDRHRDKDSWGLKGSWGSYGGNYGNFGGYEHDYHQFNNKNRYDINRRNYYLPPKPDKNKGWGQYGGTYGNNGGYLQYNGYGNGQNFNYWGFNKYEEKYDDYNKHHSYIDIPPKPDSYLPKPIHTGSYLPKPIHTGSYFPNPVDSGNYLPKPVDHGSYLPLPPKSSYFGHGSSHSIDHFENSILPAEPRFPSYDFMRDECSLRSATGFRLHKAVVRKFFSVPNIYECELLCFKEKDFPCSSYAFRYTTILNAPTDNCYLSPRNYKELDYYTDLEPDRDFDIYTMNNIKRCQQPVILGKDESECFWRVRSGQRLDHKVVRDSLRVKSIVDCQLECLNSLRFTCRAYSFRYGSSRIGGSIDNCLLTDWPFYELDPKIHFVPEYGFEVYERGSYGHGCEPDHFGIRGRHRKNPAEEIDQLCYVGFGSPARLLPQATRKSLEVSTELECKAECSKAREGTLFQCMSFSYRSTNTRGGPNCELSDILQRDLLPNIDYVPDPDAWLFAWDNFNPQCFDLAQDHFHNNHVDNGRFDTRMEMYNVLDTWRVYSVSGWPCKRGTKCKENIEAGFWFCEIEGGEHNSWDYCCHPDHQCGASKGYPYQWCYVGPSRTQWRKCSDIYYPYMESYIDRLDPHYTRPYLPLNSPHHEHPWVPSGPHYLPDSPPPLYRPGVRPDRPPGIPTEPPPRPSLDEYEMQFDNEFLSPPKPGGFGQPRRWPLSYLHKEMPPNNTDSKSRKMEMKMDNSTNPKYAAIQNLINVIKTNDLNNVQYHISNESNKQDDVLFVKIPLPTNFTKESRSQKNVLSSNTSVNLEPVNVQETSKGNRNYRRSQKALQESTSFRPENMRWQQPSYKRGFIERTNITNHARQGRSFRY